MLKAVGRKCLIFLPLILIIILFYIPLIKTLLAGFNLKNFSYIIDSPYYRRITFITFYQAFLSALLSVIMAIPGAYILTRYNFPGKKLFLSVSSLPFVVPSILTVLGFVLLFGNNGVINRCLVYIYKLELPPVNFIINILNIEPPPIRVLYSLKAVLLAHIFYNFPLAIRIISSLWKKIPYNMTEASYSLGANRITTFIKINLPYLKNSILTSFTLIFLYCFMSFGIILVLGGGPSLSTIEVEVYRFARTSINLPKAATLSLIESFITIVILLLYLRSERRNFKFPSGKGLIKKLRPKTSVLFIAYLVVLFIMILAPLLAVVFNSFVYKGTLSGDSSISLHWFKSILGLERNRFTLTALRAIKNSVLLGLATASLTVPFSLLITYAINRELKLKNIYKILFFLPMGISSIIIGLSYLSISKSNGTYLGIIFAHTVISLPLSIRVMNSVYTTINNSLIEASMSLGHNRFRTFLNIELPLVKSGIVASSVFSFALSLGEMNASIILAPSGFVTIPLAIYQLISSYNYYEACALGTFLLLICLITFKLMDNMDK